MNHDEHFAANRANWDERAAIHSLDETGFYQLARLKAGESVLDPIAAEGMGDVAGLSIAHLQCHIGTDTLSLALKGAAVTGLDFSPAALATARGLAAHLKIEAPFIEGNVYDARSLLTGHFDRVFVSWGAINWLPDIAAWAKTCASLLKPGGELFLAEAHPAILCFDWDGQKIVPKFDRQTPRDRPITEDVPVTYTGAARELKARRTYEWMHPLDAILNALSGAGLALACFDEHEALPYALFGNMERGAGGLYRLPAAHPRLPLAFSLRARLTAAK